MKTFCYVGIKGEAGRNIGRFGHVLPGDKLVLTDHEADSVEDDKRFEEWDDKKHAKLKTKAPALKRPETHSERDARVLAESRENARLDRLAKENDPDAIRLIELREKTKDQMIEVAAKEKIDVDPNATRNEIFYVISQTLRNRKELLRGAKPQEQQQQVPPAPPAPENAPDPDPDTKPEDQTGEQAPQ